MRKYKNNNKSEKKNKKLTKSKTIEILFQQTQKKNLAESDIENNFMNDNIILFY